MLSVIGRRCAFLFPLLLLFEPTALPGTPPAGRPARDVVEGEVLVRLADEGGLGALAAVEAAAGPSLAARGMSLRPAAVGLPWARVRLPAGTDVDSALAALGADPRYAAVQPVYVYRALRTPNDPEYADAWHLHNTGQVGGTVDADVDAPEAWDLFLGETTVEIAVLDTGADTDHPDLAARLRIVAGADVISGDSDPDDDSTTFSNGHGTAVSGAIGAVTNNANRIAGGTWFGRILPIRVLGVDGTGGSDSVAAGINLARMNGAKVINLSLGTPGGPGDDPLLDDAIAAAAAAGIVVVAAAGNDGGDVLYPANHPAVIAVGRTTRTGAVPSLSNGGIDLDLVAPGTEIRTLARGGETQTVSGTSFSAPIVSAAAALALGARPGADSASIARWIRATSANARTDPWDGAAGAGVANYRRLVEIALSNPWYGAETHVALFDAGSSSALADSTAGASVAAGGREGGTALRLGAAGRHAYGPDTVPDTGTIEFYWKSDGLPSLGETAAILSAETFSLSVDGAGTLRLFRAGLGTASASGRVHGAQWYHLAVVHAETHLALWVNGVEADSVSGNASLAGETLSLGGRPGEKTAAGLFDQVRLTRATRTIFPSALDAAVPPGPWATSVTGTLTAPWWTLSSETRAVRVSLFADTDAGGLDGTALASETTDDMREEVSIAILPTGTPHYLYVVATDGLDTAWAYAAEAFTPTASAAVAAGGDGGGCLLDRLGLPSPALDLLRRLRDRLLRGVAGRLLDGFYYRS